MTFLFSDKRKHARSQRLQRREEICVNDNNMNIQHTCALHTHTHMGKHTRTYTYTHIHTHTHMHNTYTFPLAIKPFKMACTFTTLVEEGVADVEVREETSFSKSVRHVGV